MKKHFWLAAIMTPFLVFVGYALTDWYLKKDRTPTALKTLTASTPCDLNQGCTLYNGDFTLTLKQRNTQLDFTANQRVQGLMVEVVGRLPPQQASQTDAEGYRWKLDLHQAAPVTKLRLVVKTHWQNYLGEFTFGHGD